MITDKFNSRFPILKILSYRRQNSCLGSPRKIHVYAPFETPFFYKYKKVSGFDQELPQSDTADQPMSRDEEPQNKNNHKTQA